MSSSNVVVFTAGSSRCALTPEEARELATRLRAGSDEDDVIGPALVVAVRIDQLLENPEHGGELRFLDSETTALNWTIDKWLHDVGATALPEGIHCLRYALDAGGRVDIACRGGIYRLARPAATALAEKLRLKATGELGSEGVQGARAAADAIEDALVGRQEDAVQLNGDRAEAVFWVLNVWATPPVAELYSLFEAVRTIHDARLAGG